MNLRSMGKRRVRRLCIEALARLDEFLVERQCGRIIGEMPDGLELVLIRPLPQTMNALAGAAGGFWGRRVNLGGLLAHLRHRHSNWKRLVEQWHLLLPGVRPADWPPSYEELRAAVDQEFAWLLINNYGAALGKYLRPLGRLTGLDGSRKRLHSAGGAR